MEKSKLELAEIIQNQKNEISELQEDLAYWLSEYTKLADGQSSNGQQSSTGSAGYCQRISDGGESGRVS